jgi:hypothetical protein
MTTGKGMPVEIKDFKTYKAFLAYSQKMQRRYIAEETKRNEKLSKLWYDYKAKASKLGFHPLDRREIEDRRDQLRGMLARVEQTHGDTPGQRALWESRHV